MTAKLFTIGDSVSQGFMSGAAANTHLCYSTLLSEVLEAESYRFLQWEEGHKTKIDLERILRKLEDKYGTNIRGLEWLSILPSINSVLDKAEDYFERGEGRVGLSVSSINKEVSFHNVSVEGMDVADAYIVTPNLCKEVINKQSRSDKKDGFMNSANAPFYRNAYRVLNPTGEAGEEKFGDFSAIDWLKYTAKKEGIENVCLMLGANNALGTILDLNIVQTPNDPERVLKAKRTERQQWNLWHPNDFKAEYVKLLDKVEAAMIHNTHDDWHVFVGNIPLVTIAPIVKGIGEHRVIKDPEGGDKSCLYYQYYTYFPLTEKSAKNTGKYLKFRDALFIDKSIIKFNKIIKELITERNALYDKPRFHLVDVCDTLKTMAYKRNLGNPSYEYPPEFDFMFPPVDTKYYHVNRNGVIESGGIFSLDGIHPTAIGQGVIAWEFLKIMQSARPEHTDKKLDWDKIIASDSLRQDPIKLMSEIYEHDKLINFLADIAKVLKLKD